MRVPDGLAGQEHLVLSAQLSKECLVHGVGLEDVPLLLARVDGLGPGLYDEEVPAVSVLGPFDIHGPSIVVLDDQGHPGEFEGLFGGQ